MAQDPDRLLALAREGEELCSIGYICVFEVLNPAAPTLVTKSNVIGNVAGSQSSSSVFGLEGQILYVPSYGKLYVVDFQNPTAPTTLATLTVPGSSGTVLIDVAASRVHLAKPCLTGQACFYVVDVSTPASPSIVGNASHTIHFLKDLYPVLSSSAPIDTLRVIRREAQLGRRAPRSATPEPPSASKQAET
ncbi:hypothetical protein WME90_08195 [Sorangium sp. So ce375]|uniref:hypothetical protein n=1 Tax=Sorangium sp. So ce375 TaxID=3133306 RepID=UPI003F5C540A